MLQRAADGILNDIQRVVLVSDIGIGQPLKLFLICNNIIYHNVVMIVFHSSSSVSFHRHAVLH